MCILLYLLSLLFSFSHASDQQTPQRIGYMSYSTLLDYDNLTGLFQTISSSLKKSQCINITEQNNVYSIKYIHPQVYYTDSQQKIAFLTKEQVNVTGGHLYFSMIFDYEVMYENGTSLSGIAETQNKLDDFWFSKHIINQKGSLIWKTNSVNDLVLRQTIFIKNSSPKLPFNDKLNIEFILNGGAGFKNSQCLIKTQSIKDLNLLYSQDLQNWLLNQHLLSTTNIIYQYAFDRQIEYQNLISNFELNEKGLLYEFMFQVKNRTTTYNKLNDTFDQQYGGNQQKIGFSQLTASVEQMAEEGWLNRHLTYDWEIPEFQFYMGDLGNYIEKANDNIPSQPFYINCSWNNGTHNILLQKYNNHQMYATIPFTCNFFLQQTQIQKLTLSVGMIITITASSKQLIFTIGPKTGISNIVFTEIDGYKIKSFNIATELAKRIIASTIGTKTYGTRFPINYRDRPSAVVEDQFILIFDAAEPY